MKTNSLIFVSLLLALLHASRMVSADAVETAGQRNPSPPSDRSRIDTQKSESRPAPGPEREERERERERERKPQNQNQDPHDSRRTGPGPGFAPRPDSGPRSGGDFGQDRGPQRGERMERGRESFAGPRGPVSPRFEEVRRDHARQKHLRRAAQHLHAAGMHEMAEHLDRMNQGGRVRPQVEGRPVAPLDGREVVPGSGVPRPSARPPGSGDGGGPGPMPRQQGTPGEQPRPENRNGGNPSEPRGQRPGERAETERLRRELGEMRQQLQKLEREFDRVNQPTR